MPKVEQYVIQPFTGEDVRRMLRAACQRRHADRDYAGLLLSYDTAIRAGELVRQRLEDVDFEGGWLRVRGKGAKERMVPPGGGRAGRADADPGADPRFHPPANLRIA